LRLYKVLYNLAISNPGDFLAAVSLNASSGWTIWFFEGEDRNMPKEGVKTYVIAPMSPLNSSLFFIFTYIVWRVVIGGLWRSFIFLASWLRLFLCYLSARPWLVIQRKPKTRSKKKICSCIAAFSPWVYTCWAREPMIRITPAASAQCLIIVLKLHKDT
jgi:hypothetical protein